MALFLYSSQTILFLIILYNKIIMLYVFVCYFTMFSPMSVKTLPDFLPQIPLKPAQLLPLRRNKMGQTTIS